MDNYHPVLARGTVHIGDKDLDCAVLDVDGTPTRVLSVAQFYSGLGVQRRALVQTGTLTRLPHFLIRDNLKPFVSSKLERELQTLMFVGQSGRRNQGFPVTCVADICDLYLQARDAGALVRNQQHIADECYRLMRAFAKTGLIALVDEATGYQKNRDADTLQRMMTKFLGDAPAKWVREFSDEYYAEAARLLNVHHTPGHSPASLALAGFTYRYAYKPILPKPVYVELCTRNPYTPAEGNRVHRKVKQHQLLTEDIKESSFRPHVSIVTGLMKASANLAQFKELFARWRAPSKTA